MPKLFESKPEESKEKVDNGTELSPNGTELSLHLSIPKRFWHIQIFLTAVAKRFKVLPSDILSRYKQQLNISEMSDCNYKDFTTLLIEFWYDVESFALFMRITK